MTPQPKSVEEEIDDLLNIAHSGFCRRREWVQGQTEPHPCDCYVIQLRQSLLSLIEKKELEAEIRSLERVEAFDDEVWHRDADELALMVVERIRLLKSKLNQQGDINNE